MVDDVCNGSVVLEDLLLGKCAGGGEEHQQAADEQGEDADDEALGNILGGILAFLGAHAACLKGKVEPYCVGDCVEDALYAAELAHLAEEGEVAAGKADACVQDNACNADDGDDEADGLTGFNAAHVDEQEDEVCHNRRYDSGDNGEQGVNVCAYCNADTGGAEQGFNQIAEACEEACAAAEGLLGVGCGACGAGDRGRQFCKHEREGDIEQSRYRHCDERAGEVGACKDVVPAVVAAGNNRTDRDCPYACGSQGFLKFVFFHLWKPPYKIFYCLLYISIQLSTDHLLAM